MTFPVSSTTKVRNRYGNYVRFHDLSVYLVLDAQDVHVDARFSTGATAGSLSLSRDDARLLAESILKELGVQ